MYKVRKLKKIDVFAKVEVENDYIKCPFVFSEVDAEKLRREFA